MGTFKVMKSESGGAPILNVLNPIVQCGKSIFWLVYEPCVFQYHSVLMSLACIIVKAKA